MADPKTDDRTLAERENDASDRWTELYGEALDVKARFETLEQDVTRIEGVSAALDDQAFEIAVQQSGALDMMNGPVAQDGDGHVPLMEVVNARTEDLQGEVIDAAGDLAASRADMRELEHDMDLVEADVMDLGDEVHAIRAEGGHIHPEATDAEREAQEWTDERLEEAAHAHAE